MSFFETLTSPFYGVMDLIFGPFFHLTSNAQQNNLIGVLVVSIFVSLVITVATAKLVDQELMKKYKKKLKTYQDQMSKVQKKGDTKKLQKVQGKMMGLQGEMMKLSFKPMIYTMIPIVVIFGWLGHTIPREVVVATLPFSIPKYGTTLGWLGWYIFASIPTSSLLKKILNIEGP
ncbi:MAG: EMC3/TMCO1 family protein [Candidatus Hydrothermarchaeales archaeon]